MFNLFGLRIMTVSESQDLANTLEMIGGRIGDLHALCNNRKLECNRLSEKLDDLNERPDDMEGRLADAVGFAGSRNDDLSRIARREKVWPHRGAKMMYSHPTLGDERIWPLINEAIDEFFRHDPQGARREFTASNGITITVCPDDGGADG